MSRIAADVIGSDRECERLDQQDPSPTVLFSAQNAIVQLPSNNWLCDDVLLPSEKDCRLGTHFIAAPSKFLSFILVLYSDVCSKGLTSGVIETTTKFGDGGQGGRF